MKRNLAGVCSSLWRWEWSRKSGEGGRSPRFPGRRGPSSKRSCCSPRCHSAGCWRRPARTWGRGEVRQTLKEQRTSSASAPLSTCFPRGQERPHSNIPTLLHQRCVCGLWRRSRSGRIASSPVTCNKSNKSSFVYVQDIILYKSQDRGITKHSNWVYVYIQKCD